MKKREVNLVNYDPKWPFIYEQEAVKLAHILHKNLLKIDHIGSTSVKGLSAKPIIDILVEVHSFELLSQVTEKIKFLGYINKFENGIKGRRYFQKGGIKRTHHLHIFEAGDQHLYRHRTFRNYLIANRLVAQEYEKVKRQAVLACNNDMVQYIALKNDFIVKHEKLALAWNETVEASKERI